MINVIKKPYKLRLYPDSVLRKEANPVKNVDGSVVELLNGMAEIMYSYNGIGLAAPQVGVLKQLVIADIGDGLISLLNPEIIEREGEDKMIEGCLSLPETQVNISRNQSVLVRGIDRNGNESERELIGLKARVIQHEIDHLHGVLIIDYGPNIGKEHGIARQRI